MRVGVIGYSGQRFDLNAGRAFVRKAFDLLPRHETIEVVSGLTYLGIPAIAYEEAVRRGWKTAGVACSKAIEFECFPVDRSIIVGREWGDESQTFLNIVDVVIRVGGGKQAHEEARQAKLLGKPVFEFELPALLMAG